MKKKWNLLIDNKFYSCFNQKIELNFRTRSLKYFAGKKNPNNNALFNNKNKKSKKKSKEIYTGGTLNFSCDDKKKEFKFESIFDKKNNTTNSNSDSRENSEKKTKNKKKVYIKMKNLKSSNILIDHAIESPFKYNPKYKSIYKNLPNIKINPKRYGPEIKRKIITNIELRKKILLEKKEKEKEKINMKKIEIKKCNNFGKNVKKVFNKTKKNEKFKNKNNHAISFEKNISRNKADIIYKNDKSRILTYIKNYNYISNNKHKIVNYKKMLSRNEFEIMGKKYNEYGGLTYTPKYSVIDKNIPSIIFDSKDRIQKNEKKIKIRKILSSFNVLKHYEIIDENQISKNAFIKIKN